MLMVDYFSWYDRKLRGTSAALVRLKMVFQCAGSLLRQASPGSLAHQLIQGEAMRTIVTIPRPSIRLSPHG